MPETPIDAMSLDECQDELARAQGWRSDNIGWHRGDRGTLDCEYAQDHEHPIPSTLDAIAACMPEGCHTQIVIGAGVHVVGWRPDDASHASHIRKNADTEILARARLALACIRATK